MSKNISPQITKAISNITNDTMTILRLKHIQKEEIHHLFCSVFDYLNRGLSELDKQDFVSDTMMNTIQEFHSNIIFITLDILYRLDDNIENHLFFVETAFKCLEKQHRFPEITRPILELNYLNIPDEYMRLYKRSPHPKAQQFTRINSIVCLKCFEQILNAISADSVNSDREALEKALTDAIKQ